MVRSIVFVVVNVDDDTPGFTITPISGPTSEEGGTATGAGFLEWFYNGGNITAEKGYDWAGKDTAYLEKAADAYEWEQIRLSIPTNQTLDFTGLQSGN